MTSEADLYAPVKDLLARQGYDVKAEVNGCDVVAVKDGAPDVVVELKLSLSLDLVLQGIDRLGVSDSVYLAVPAPDTPGKRRNWRSRRRRVLKLCRMLGLGLILVDPGGKPGRQTEVLLDPAPYQPRKNNRRRSILKTEFVSRRGDPNTGGTTRMKIVTAYRQDALRCAATLNGSDGMTLADIRATAGVPRAGSILQNNHYGWFERTGRGVYRLSEHGQAALEDYRPVLPDITETEHTQNQKA